MLILKGSILNQPAKPEKPSSSPRSIFQCLSEIRKAKETGVKQEDKEVLPFDSRISDQVKRNRKSSFLSDMFTID